MPRTAITCAVCHRRQLRGAFSDAGDIFICVDCQADAKHFLETQNSIWAEGDEPSTSSDGPDGPVDP